MIELDYSTHRIKCTAVSTSPVDVRYYVMPLYGPEEWFESQPETQQFAAQEGETK